MDNRKAWDSLRKVSIPDDCPECEKLMVPDLQRFRRLIGSGLGVPMKYIVARCHPIEVEGKISYFMKLEDNRTFAPSATERGGRGGATFRNP